MRVDVTPRRAEVLPGTPTHVAVTISNASTVIGGYVLRILGADPSWVEVDTDEISLFPDETRTVMVALTLPSAIPSGVRRIAVQVRELAPPFSSTVAEVDLVVPKAESVQVRVDPLTVTAGRKAAFSVVVTNTGNTTVLRLPAGDDPESLVDVSFLPRAVELQPGEHSVVDLRARARRPFMGSPAVRVLSIYLDEVGDTPRRPSGGRRRGDDPSKDADGGSSPGSTATPDSAPARDDRTALATATFIQRPLLSRGPISLVGLLAAATVFAIVITIALSRLVGQSAADRDLALQVAAARDVAAASGTSGMAGSVLLLTSGAAVPGVAVNAFSASDTVTPIASTSTDAKGAFAFTSLAAGDYKLSFRGAGFVQLWYPAAASDANAQVVSLKESQQLAGLEVRLGGVPATIAGTVTGDDVSAATLYLKTIVPAAGTSGATSSTTKATGATGATGAGGPDDGGAIVRTVPIGADGAFALTDVPSPSIYRLVVSKPGYATSAQDIDVGAGENRRGVQIRLLKGDGLISGHVNTLGGRLGGATLTATVGQTTVSTVSLTADDPGAFVLRGLPTPASFTVVATRDGYASQTLTLTLAAGASLTGVEVTLGQSSGSLEGQVTSAPSGAAAAGVTVTVTNGSLTVQTVTESTGTPGHWTVGGLPVPGTYTVTFSRADLASQTVAVALDATGAITAGSQGGGVSGNRVVVTMGSSTAVVYGTVSQPETVSVPAQPLGEATVTLNSGTSSYVVRSASVGAPGAYRIERIPPGTYTLTVNSSSGTTPRSTVVSLVAGQVSRQDVTLAAPASLAGTVVGSDGTARVGWTVTLYLATQYPTVATATQIAVAPNGSFSFPDIDAGNYIVEVRPTAGSPPSASKTVTVKASDQIRDLVVVADLG